MPKVYSAISEQTDHIYDVIAKQFSHKILEDLDLVKTIKNNIYIDTGYSAPQRTNDEDHNSVLQKDKLTVKAVPNTNPTSLKWDTLTGQHVTGQMVNSRSVHRQFAPILVDKSAEIYLRELSIPTSISLEFQFELLSRDQAYEIPSQLFRRYAAGQVFTETLTYDYPIPNDLLSLIFSLYRMRRLNPEKKFHEYLLACGNGKINFNASRAIPGNIELIVPKTLINTVATLEYSEDKPEEVKNNRSAQGYEIKFNVIFQFERADMMLLQYPCIVDNQLLPPNMIPMPINQTPMDSLDGDHPVRVYANGISEWNTYSTSPIIMPSYDDWLIPPSLAKERSYCEFLVAAFLVDEKSSDGYTDIDLSENLSDEGDQLHPIVKEILTLQKRESFDTDCIFNIRVYLGDKLVEPSTLKFDENLILKVPCSDLKKVHRLVISEITSLKYLNPKWLPYIMNKYPFFRLSKVIENLIANGLLVPTNGTVYDPRKNVIGGTDDSYWPLRIIRADIITKREAIRD